MATVTITSSSYSKPQQKKIQLRQNPEWNSISEKAKAIATYFIPYHLRNCVKQELLKGLPRPYLIPPQQPPELFTFTAKMCTQMEEENTEFFSNLPEKVNLKAENAQRVFLGLCNEIFTDGVINWGRVISIFTLAGACSVYFVKKGQPKVVQNFPLWVQEFVDQELSDWIIEQGGWDDLRNSFDKDSRPGTWSKAIAVGSVVAAAGYLLFSTGLGR